MGFGDEFGFRLILIYPRDTSMYVFFNAADCSGLCLGVISGSNRDLRPSGPG